MYVSQVYAEVDYTDAYLCTAIGNETTTVKEMGYFKEGELVSFEASPNLNHRFLGWYSNSGCTDIVTDKALYQITISNKNITLYANSRRIEAVNVYYKKNGTWSLVRNLYVKENGQYKVLTPQEFGNHLYFSDKTYLNL